ncbi:MAG: hypothetical protein GU354_07180 [Caldimicrobium sp.]|nr:hypothetical protein [Caldimicrobium sp.]
MRNYKQIIEKLLNNQISSKEYQTFLKDLKRIFKQALKVHFTSNIEKLFHKYFGPDYLEVLASEVIFKIVSKKESFLNLSFINEKYLLTTAINIIYLYLSSEFKLVEKEVNLEDLSLTQEEDKEQEIRVEGLLSPVFVNFLEDSVLNHLVLSLKEKLTKKELETLCWYIYKAYKQNPKEVKASADALYKRWERLKPKLEKILGEEVLEGTSAEKLFYVIKSEICDKLS